MDITILTRFLNGFLMILIPIGLGIFLSRRFKSGWRLWWIGAAAFVLSQIGHIPFNYVLDQLFQRGVLSSPPETWTSLFNAFVLGLSAGMWEEIILYAVYRYWAKDARTWEQGVSLGAGRGGIESILIGLYVLVIFIQMVMFRFGDIKSLIPINQIPILEQQLAVYWSSPWYDTLLGVLERSFTIVFHISAALLVMQVFVRGQSRWLLLAVLWHTLVNAGAVYLALEVNPYAAEVWMAAVCLVSFMIIYILRDSKGNQNGYQPSTLEDGNHHDLPINIEVTAEHKEIAWFSNNTLIKNA